MRKHAAIAEDSRIVAQPHKPFCQFRHLVQEHFDALAAYISNNKYSFCFCQNLYIYFILLSYCFYNLPFVFRVIWIRSMFHFTIVAHAL